MIPSKTDLAYEDQLLNKSNYAMYMQNCQIKPFLTACEVRPFTLRSEMKLTRSATLYNNFNDLAVTEKKVFDYCGEKQTAVSKKQRASDFLTKTKNTSKLLTLQGAHFKIKIKKYFY